MTYAHAFVGGGIAASSLALRLVRDGAGPILLVDPHEPDPRTFAFWSDWPLGVEQAVTHRWTHLRVAGDDGEADLDLDPWRYQIAPGESLREQARAAVEASGGRVLRGRVDRVDDADDHAVVWVGDEALHAAWVYDSRVPDHAPGLVQSFTGWWVEAEADAFDPTTATLMDFRAPQDEGGVRFFHVMPVTPRRALVTGVNLAPEARGADVGRYLRALGVPRWRVLREERGATPMTTHRFARRVGRRILAIGTAGGRLKPSTGYAFVRMQEDAERIATSLREHGHPFHLPPDRWTWRLLDAVLLRVVARHGPATAAVFLALFRRNPVDRVLRFLDERASLGDALRIVWTLPHWGWFLAATAAVGFNRRRPAAAPNRSPRPG